MPAPKPIERPFATSCTPLRKQAGCENARIIREPLSAGRARVTPLCRRVDTITRQNQWNCRALGPNPSARLLPPCQDGGDVLRTLLIGLTAWMSLATVVGLIMGRIMYDTNQPAGRAEPSTEEAA